MSHALLSSLNTHKSTSLLHQFDLVEGRGGNVKNPRLPYSGHEVFEGRGNLELFGDFKSEQT